MTTTLGIWAHPDDEVFVAGGLLADAARRGERVVCIHLTGGEAGLSYGRPSSPETLADVRRDELKASLELLGVEEQRFLGYSDGRLPETPRDQVIASIHDALVEVQPDAIVTFGRDGFTGHPDHRSLSALVTAALKVWDQPEARLLQAAVSADWKDSFAPALNEFNVFWPGHPTAITDPDVTIELDDELLDAKVEALRAHSSQMTPFFDAYGDDFMRALASTEHYQVCRVRQTDPAPTAGRRLTMKQIQTFRTKRSNSFGMDVGSEVKSRPSGCGLDIDRLLTQIDCALREAAHR
jgi:LmbE family N-acetylglucosaminyl deacetylase